MDGSDGGFCTFGDAQDASASPSMIIEGASPSAPSSLSFRDTSPEGLPALLPDERAELMLLREEVANLRLRLTKASESHSGKEGLHETPGLRLETPDKDRRRRDYESPEPEASIEISNVGDLRRRSDWALRERAYRCARDAFMDANDASGTGRVVRAQLLATMRQQEPEVAAYFESPRQQFRQLLVEGDPEGIIEWDDFVNCYVQQCKQSISAVKAMEPEREGSPATASTRSPVLPLQRCSEITGRNVNSLSDLSHSHLQELRSLFT